MTLGCLRKYYFILCSSFPSLLQLLSFIASLFLSVPSSSSFISPLYLFFSSNTPPRQSPDAACPSFLICVAQAGLELGVMRCCLGILHCGFTSALWVYKCASQSWLFKMDFRALPQVFFPSAGQEDRKVDRSGFCLTLF